MRPDVVFLQRRLLAGRVDRPLDVGQVERIEGALPRLQMEVPKPAERPAELQAVIGIARVRDPLDKNAPRTIDVDLSLFNYDVFEWAGHRVPDPEILERPFVAVPLAELDPDYVHPTEGRRLADIAASWTSNSGLVGRPDVRLR